MREWYDSIRNDFGYEIVASVATLVVAVVARWLLIKAIERWTKRVEARYSTSHEQHDREYAQRIATIAGVLRVVVNITVWIIVLLTIMGIWGIPLSPLVAVGATVGVAIGFGAQDFVKDVIGGFLILVEDQYSIDDVVTIAGVSGTVEAITLRTTVLRDLDGNQHHVPNGEVRVSSNMTSGFSRVVIDVPVAYDTDLDAAIEVVADEARILNEDPEWAAAFIEAPVMLGVNSLGDSAIDIRVLVTTTTEQRWNVKREYLKRIKQRLDREHIEIPFQYVNVVLPERGDQS